MTDSINESSSSRQNKNNFKMNQISSARTSPPKNNQPPKKSTSPSLSDRCSEYLSELPPFVKSVIGLTFVLAIFGGIGYGIYKLVMNYLGLPEEDKNCSEAKFCDEFYKNKGWWIASQVVAWLTTVLEFVIWFWFRKEMMHIEMTPDSRMGLTHNLIFKHIEFLWELPLKWFCKLVCCECQEKDFDKRLDELPDDAEDEDIYKEQEKILRENKSAWIEMFTFSFLGLILELGQRILDIPYFSGPSAFFGDCNGLSEARLVTKPVVFYVIFVVVEIVGLFLYWWGMSLTADAVEDKKYRRSNSMIVLLLSFVEIPVMMILEYFFHERFLSSDSLAENTLVLMNNIFTLVFVLSLFSLAVDFIYSNVRPIEWLLIMPNNFVDGELDVFELMLFISSMLLVVASIIRLIVNTNGTEEMKFDSFKVGNITDHMDSNNTLNTTCKEFKADHFGKFTWHDWTYFVSTIVPILFLLLFFLSRVLSNKLGIDFLRGFFNFGIYNGNTKKWYWQDGFEDESDESIDSISN